LTPTARVENLTMETADGAHASRILKIAGQLTLRTLFEFQTATREEAGKPLIVEMSGLEYMDSAGLGSVIGAFTSCQRTDRGFAIVGVSGRIHVLFQVTHVEGLLPCFATIEAAESSLAAATA
jgi:anti-anti-sigma factor